MSKAIKILVVDDDPDIADQLSILLKPEGYEVTVAGSQEEGEQALLSCQPDLAIVDLMMEEKDSGFILCHEVKKLFPETPVILLTSVTAATGISFAGTSEEQRSWVKADRLMDKPIRAEQIKNEVRKLLVKAGKLQAQPAGAKAH
jgi:DNA-binding response OmpR family regulator